MNRAYVNRLHVRGYRCVRNADLALTPLHALIGPNDSGKSSLLAAFAACCAKNHSDPAAPQAAGSIVEAYVGSRKLVSLAPTFRGVVSSTIVVEAEVAPRGMATADPSVADLAKIAVGAELLRLDPDALRTPTPLIASDAPRWFLSDRGLGLGSLLDLIVARDVAQYLELETRFKALFPTVSKLQRPNTKEGHKGLGVRLIDGTEVDAKGMSEGMLYWLAFACLPYLDGPPIVLIEEPENGLHPSRIRDVMRALRDVSATTQVLIATHSPLVINELQPNEVTLITRTAERGTIATPIAQTKNFEERSRVYALGELWLSYADGDLERELVEGPSDPAKEPAA